MLSLSPGEQPKNSAPLASAACQIAKSILDYRSKRNSLFGAGLFGEPAWEIQLSFLAYPCEDGLTINDLSEILGFTPAATSRWLDYLVKKSLVTARGDQPQRFFLTRKTVALLTELVGMAQQASLSGCSTGTSQSDASVSCSPERLIGEAGME